MRSGFRSFILYLSTVALILSVALVAGAQHREKFVISAHAGGVNAIAGRPEFRSAPAADWQLLNVTDDLRTGDLVRTGRDGRVEMLLNPGSYFRVAEDSEFELSDNSLENLEIKLVRGTAIIEATGGDDTELAINVVTPQARMMIVKKGLYRVSVIPGNTTELIVRKGRVLLGDSQTKIKGGNKIIFSGTTFSVAKLSGSDKQADQFDDWSKLRAETVAQANRKVELRSLNSFLARSDPWGWDLYRSSGLWFYNPGYRCFSFLPFYFGWGSPYGARYSNIFYVGGYDWYGWPGRPQRRIVTSTPTVGPAPARTSAPGTSTGSAGGNAGRIGSTTPRRTISDPNIGRATRGPDFTPQPSRPTRPH